eukprot:scaffold2156_cov430-Prasinococcus_capsulatus_cf.AAC.3
MSAKLVDTTTRMPKSFSAHGACSLEDPHPKLSPAIYGPRQGRGRNSRQRRVWWSAAAPDARWTVWLGGATGTYQDGGRPVGLAVEHEGLLLLALSVVAQLVEGVHAQAGALDGLEELLGDDHVRVHVLQVQRRRHALHHGEGRHAAAAGAAAAGGRLGGHRREGAHVREEVRAPAGALAPLEVAVGGGGAALPGQQLVGVHGEAHGAAGLPPVEARLHQHLVQPLGLGLLLDQARAGHHHGVHVLRDAAAAGHGRGGAHVLKARVGAGADEHLVDLDAGDGLAALEAHVGEGALHGSTALGVGLVGGQGDEAGDGEGVLGAGAPGEGGGHVSGVDHHLAVVRGALVRGQASPVGERALPLLRALGRGHGASPQVLDGHLVRRHHPRARARLDGHVAHGHARLHRQRPHRLAAELDHRARAARSADDADDVQHQVLRHPRHSQRQPPPPLPRKLARGGWPATPWRSRPGRARRPRGWPAHAQQQRPQQSEHSAHRGARAASSPPPRPPSGCRPALEAHHVLAALLQ